ncbi:LysM peptidoglycan-binding domain-containing protein [candidate division KSB1 bacterium]|nr:LysM peptidoglycan-binding domain-containing protein [candidate division KSB1 bacterium]
MNGSYYNYMPVPFNSDFEFFQTLRGYLKFSLFVLFVFTLLVVIVWNMQPWFEIEIKPVDKLKEAPSEENSSTKSLQSNVEIVTYVVRPGDTLSEIAESFEVSVPALLKHNHLDNPNVLRSGQRLKIPRRPSR